MRPLILLPLACSLWLPVPGSAQSLRARASELATAIAAAPAPAAAQAPAPAPSAPAPATEPAQSPVPEAAGSLFEPTWRQVQLGGRFTTVDGDPARFQRYQDVRDGLLFTDAKYAHEAPNGAWQFHATADNLGWRDQRYTASYERPGRFAVTGYFDQIPQFYSIDTRTPYVTSGGVNTLDDATQSAIQSGQTTLNAYVPLAPQFDLRERRDVGTVSVTAAATPALDLSAAFTTQRHVGQLPWGASFGFSNDVEVGVPYDSRTNDFTVGAEWTKSRSMFRVAYTGSWFDNLDDTLVWDSPLRLTDSAEDGPGRGRMALWPSNSAQTVSAAGYTKFARRTQLTGFISYGSWSNDEPLQPFTINSALPQLALPRATAEVEAKVFSTNLNLVSRPSNDWRYSGRLRHYDYNNETPRAAIPQFVSYDDGVSTTARGGPQIYAHDRTTLDADVTWSKLLPLAITAGYTHNRNGYDFRIFDSTSENVFYLTADAVGSSWVTFRANYEFADRLGDGLNEALLHEIHEQPLLRYYDLANRTRNRFTGQVDVVPNDLWTVSASASIGDDDYDDSYFGLQEATFRTFTLGADFRRPDGLGAGASYTYERYSGFQTSRSANPGQETDPLRDWTTDSKERVNYFSIYAFPPRIGANTEARIAYDYSYAEGSYFYGIPQGSPLTPPNQLPNVFNKLQQLHLDVRHRLTHSLAATFSYLYEPFRVYDFAFDPSVVNGIVQPSSLVLGYVYRPYTAHSAVLGLRYLW
jgi:MtrB/PioB family decaheme-associated outer membrane protein